MEKSLAAKEFRNDFYETLIFVDRPINIDKVAIIKTTIPDKTYNQLKHMNLDSFIFKSGTPVVEPEIIEMFNRDNISIEHVYYEEVDKDGTRCRSNFLFFRRS